MTAEPIADERATNSRGDQRLTDLKYRWPARYRASWAALLLVILGAAVVAPHALSGDSITLVTALAGVLAIASFGQVLIVTTGAIDLSISAIVSVAAGIVVHYADSGTNVWLLALLALVVCAVLSLINGVLIVILRLNALIVTLATVGAITGLIQLWTGVALSASGLRSRSWMSRRPRSGASTPCSSSPSSPGPPWPTSSTRPAQGSPSPWPAPTHAPRRCWASGSSSFT